MKSFGKTSNSFLKLLLSFFIFSSLLIPHALAQRARVRFAASSDAVIDSAPRRIASKACNMWSSYIPDTVHPEFTPMRYVRINVHVMQDANGKNNFQEAEGRKWVKEMI